MLDGETPVNVDYLDFSKAFGSVSHKLPPLMLKSHDIRGDLLMGLEAFLSGSCW